MTKICSSVDCERKAIARGLCDPHYSRWKRGSSADGPIRQKEKSDTTGWIDSAGYRRVSVDGKEVLEHRWIISQELGRPLLRHETVHHINGDRQDNRRENLELWSSYQPPGQRVADKVEYAKEILALYGNL